MPEPTPLAGFSEQARQQALTRFQHLRPHLEDGVALTALARQYKIPRRTLQRWLQHYRQSGLVGLCRPAQPNKLARRTQPQLVQFIEGLALRNPPPSAAAVHRQTLLVAQQHGWTAPSYRTVYNIIHAIDPGLRTLAHDGANAYQEAYDLLFRREASRANEMWQADHCLLDIWLLNPAGKPTRPWLTVILDDYSRAVAGYLLGFKAPSSLQTALALRQAIWRKTVAGCARPSGAKL